MRFDRRARAWVESVTGEGVERTRVMRGGVSSAIHEVALSSGRRVVLRRTIPFDDDPHQDPRAEAEREVRSLELLASLALVPDLLAAEVTGEACGAPAVLVTRLPGRPWVPAPARVSTWVHGLAEAVHAVQAVEVPIDGLTPARPWLFGDGSPPVWTDDPDAWRWARAVAEAGLPPGTDDRFVHRDLHPGNVVFSRGRLTGIVDWESACRGPVEVDVSRCRVQTAVIAGFEAADALLALCVDVAPDYDPRWDAVVATELAPWTDALLTFNDLAPGLTLAGVRASLDEVVVRARSATG